MQNNVQRPMFTSASQSAAKPGGTATEDFDLNEIFAEYFINEFDDPMNAYTSSMANYGLQPNAAQASLANSLLEAQRQSAPAGAPAAVAETGVALPTGGIKTAFHMGAAGASKETGVQVPQPKKQRPDTVASAAGRMQTSTTPQFMSMSSIPDPTPVSAPLTSNDVLQAMKLQAAGAAAAMAHPGMPAALLQQVQQQQQQQFAAASAALSAGVAAPNASSRVDLPVGVGIRLGGVGGIAPATAQQVSAPAMMHPQLATLWGGGAAATTAMASNSSNPAGVVQEEKALAERRHRNREHAKRSRVRKKFMLESMQAQVLGLQKENKHLRMLVQEHIPESATQIISECCNSSPIFAGPEDAASDAPKAADLTKTDFNLMESLAAGQKCFVLSDPKLPDNPIVFASGGFYEMTGYDQREVLGRNCRFLQGPATDPRAVDVIRKAVSTGSDATVCLLNYKADGTPFWNQFFIAALRDADNCIVNYVGVQCEVGPENTTAALEEKVNAVLPLQAKDDQGKDAMEGIKNED